METLTILCPECAEEELFNEENPFPVWHKEIEGEMVWVVFASFDCCNVSQLIFESRAGVWVVLSEEALREAEEKKETIQ